MSRYNYQRLNAKGKYVNYDPSKPDYIKINKKTGLVSEYNIPSNKDYTPTFFRVVFTLLLFGSLFASMNSLSSGGDITPIKFSTVLNFATSNDWSISSSWISEIGKAFDDWSLPDAFSWIKNLLSPFVKFFQFGSFISVGAINIVSFLCKWVFFFFNFGV